VRKEGKMVGDIKAPRVVIADGAKFKGNIEMGVD
jgi:cytoskeletal protein CcmA (bactofilin family)